MFSSGSYQFGIHAGNFIQFVFPATDAFPAQSGFFSFAIYITKVALKGRVVLENPDQVGDPSAAQVPLLDRLNTTAETCRLSPSAFPGLFKHLVSVPFYRLPKTLGWPYSDAPLNGALIPDPPLARLDLSPLYSLCSGFSPSSLHPRSVTRLPTTSKLILVAITLLMLLFTSSKKACALAPRNKTVTLKKPTIGRSIGSSRTWPPTSARAFPRVILKFFNSSPP